MHRVLVALVLSLSIITGVCAERYSKDVFVTWELFEADKLASIWLIKRFINPEAEIKIVSRDANVKNGTLFDTPDAYFKRTFNKCTYEMLKEYYSVKGDKIDAIGKLIHDIEINRWDRKRFTTTQKVEQFVLGLIQSKKSNEEIIALANAFFDSLYENKDRALDAALKGK